MKNIYKIDGDITTIYLKTQNGDDLETIIDTADLERVKEFPRAWRANTLARDTVYVNGSIGLHRWLLMPEPGLQVDHINHDTLDNRRSNLRICTGAENSQNKKMYSTNKSGVTGVWKNGSKWSARIGTGGKIISLGSFSNIKDAITARKNAEIKYFGEFASIIV